MLNSNILNLCLETKEEVLEMVRKLTKDDIFCLTHFVELHLWNEERKVLGEKIKELLQETSKNTNDELVDIIDTYQVFQEIWGKSDKPGELPAHSQEKHTDEVSVEEYEEDPWQ